MKKQAISLITLLSLGLIVGCSNKGNSSSIINSSEVDSTDFISESSEIDYSDISTEINDSDWSGEETESDFNIKTKVTDGYVVEGKIYKIIKVGDYTLTGLLNEGQIVIDVGESETDVENEVSLTLDGVSITSSDNSPIYVKSADKVKIKSQKGSYNVIDDKRQLKVEDVDGQGNGAIYSKCDLNLTGKGTLVVSSTYNNGVHTTKDLKIKNTTLKVTAVNNAIKGNNSITISEASTNILAISTGGDGLKSDDSDISSSGNQKGYINISGGSVNIYAAGDAIDAAYDVNISNGVDEDTNETTIPVINAFTNKYSTYTGEVSPTSSKEMYLKMGSSFHNLGYTYAAKFSDGNSDSWVTAKYETSKTSGRNGTYYYYKFDRPANSIKFKLYAYSKDQTPQSEDYTACTSEYVTINQNYDTCTIGWISASDKTITISTNNGSWTNFNQPTGGGPGGGFGNEGNNDKADESAKGIKSDNVINIAGGKINLKTYDDGIHANGDVTLQNGNKGLGDVVISGGDITIDASDDGVHADRYLNIEGGKTNVINSYEGLEGNVITVSGGASYVVASDDGVNASNKSSITPLIKVTGGYLDVTVNPSGDTDGIDSNGGYEQTGGVVVTRGPSSQNASSLDIDERSTANMTGGTLICLGKNAARINYSSLNINFSKVTGTISSGNHVLTIGELRLEIYNKYSYNGCYCYSQYIDSVVAID